jgi:rod shape determining protein RodA
MNFSTLVLKIKKLDLALFLSTILIISIGLISLYSSSIGRNDFSNFKKQLFFAFSGLLLMLFFSFFNWRFFRDNPYFVLIIYFLFLLLLLGLLIFAYQVRGIRKWYHIGPFSFDPAEFMNIALIIILAKYFSTRHIEIYRIRHIFISLSYFILPGLLLFLQPDIGGIIIIFSLWFGILLVSGIKLRHIFFIIVIGIIFSMVAWFYLLHDYQKQRVISFLFVQDPQGASWSQNQAKIAIGSGGFWGKGFAKGSQTQLKFLPEPQTDFIFSAIAEEFGFIGVFSLLLLYCILLWRLIIIAINSKSNFPRLFAVGVAILLGSKMIINVGMNLGLLPVIGIPIPLVSYGGSNMIATMISLGIVQSTKLS